MLFNLAPPRPFSYVINIPLMFSSFSFNCILRDDIVSCNVSISCLVSTDVRSVYHYIKIEQTILYIVPLGLDSSCTLSEDTFSCSASISFINSSSLPIHTLNIVHIQCMYIPFL